MASWFDEMFVATGRVPLLCFFGGMIGGFGFIRLSVRLIRAEVRWWPGNITPGDLHIHHVVFGVVFMMIGGVTGITTPDGDAGWRAAAAGLFGIGAALVLDEFSLILHLKDVYWSEKGRLSVDAVFVAIALTGMLLLGFRPRLVDDFLLPSPAGGPLFVVICLVDLAFAVITLLKGKIWTGLIGVFLPALLVVGAIRLGRPQSPWARWRYAGRPRKLAKARWREQWLRVPVIRGKIWVQELIAGRHERV